MPLAPMLAAALAVNEAFLHIQGAGAIAGRRKIGMSLWDPSIRLDWEATPPAEPQLQFLPCDLWLLGLGHLGQAYLWALSTLPYEKEGDLRLVLQDTDTVTDSSISTSVLSNTPDLGEKKTRALAAWCKLRGFNTNLIERKFDEFHRRQEDDPVVALCGFDNPDGRLAMENTGFSYIVEAGLGQGHEDFRTLQVHTLPSNRSFRSIWAPRGPVKEAALAPAYQRMLATGEGDKCGITQLAGKAVGAPFVGSVAACLVLSEVLRQLHGGQVHDLISLDLLDLAHREVVSHPQDFASVNPRFVRSARLN